MAVVDRRISTWVDLVRELVGRPTNDFPRALLQQRLFETFGCWVSWDWKDPGSAPGFIAHVSIPGWPTPEAYDDMRAAENDHPLMRWYVSTGDLRPMTTGRVPRSMVSPVAHAMSRDHLSPVGIDEQLSIPYRLGPDQFRLFLLGRTGDDFPVEDLETARQLQPLLRLTDRHFQALRRAPTVTEQSGLTGREIAVVQLLAEGLTAAAIADRLAISPRTVHRHLAGLYRKLGASDRVRAVLAAQQAGLLAVTGPAGSPAIPPLQVPTGPTGRSSDSGATPII